MYHKQSLSLFESFCDHTLVYVFRDGNPLCCLIGTPSNMMIVGPRSDNTSDVSSTLTCSAVAYPPATFTWTDIQSGRSVQGATFTMIELGVRNVRCTATNTIRGTSRNITMTKSVTVYGSIFHHFREVCFNLRECLEI